MKTRHASAILLVGAGIAAAIWALTVGPGDSSTGRIDPEAAVRLGALLRDAHRLDEEGDLPGARRAWEEAIRIDPSNAEAHRRLAGSYRKELNLRRALEIIEEAIESHPGDLALRLERGQIFETMGEYARAREEYRRVVELEAEDAQAHLRLSASLLRLNRFPEAIRAARRGLELGPDDPEAHLVIGAASVEMEDPSTAEMELRRGLSMDPGMLEARYLLGHLLRRQGRVDEGVRELERAGRISDSLVEIQRLEAIYESVRHGGPDRRRVLELARRVGRAYLGAFRFTEAERIFRETIRSRPLDAELNFFLGIALLGQGKEEEALRVLREALRREPQSASVAKAIEAIEARLPSTGQPTRPRLDLVERILRNEAP